jgi:hypothetical protein
VLNNKPEQNALAARNGSIVRSPRGRNPYHAYGRNIRNRLETLSAAALASAVAVKAFVDSSVQPFLQTLRFELGAFNWRPLLQETNVQALYNDFVKVIHWFTDKYIPKNLSSSLVQSPDLFNNLYSCCCAGEIV